MKDYFSEIEFKLCSPPCSKADMNAETLKKLNLAREDAAIPFVITSAYRSKEWDKSKGRSGTGAHTLGRAVDIRCKSSKNKYKILIALLDAGFNRIGISASFIHADDSPNHEQQVIWTY